VPVQDDRQRPSDIFIRSAIGKEAMICTNMFARVGGVIEIRP
jgi:hypothetical protein